VHPDSLRAFQGYMKSAMVATTIVRSTCLGRRSQLEENKTNYLLNRKKCFLKVIYNNKQKEKKV
jgi:hypothetical protein